MRTLGFIGKSRLEGAQALIPGLVKNWHEQWCFDAQALCVVECSDEVVLTEQAALAPLSWQKAQGKTGALWLSSCQATAWQCAIFGSLAKDVPSDATAEHLLKQAQLALVNGLLTGLQQGAVATLTTESPCTLGGYMGSRLSLRISLQGGVLYLLMDAALLDHFLPPLPVTKALTQRELAIGGAKVKLHVRIPLANLSIGELKGLNPGDVLRANASLTQPLQLATEKSKVVANGYLARQQEQLALQLTTTN